MFNLFLALLITGCASQIQQRESLKKMLSFVFFALLITCFAIFVYFGINSYNISNSFQWLSKLKMSLSFNLEHYQTLLPIFIISVACAFVNLLANMAKEPIKDNGFIIFTLCAIMLLVCASNLVQIFVGLFLIEAVGTTFIPKENKNRYFYFNITADFALWFVFAYMYSTNERIDIKGIELGSHKEIMGIVLLLSLVIKMGLFGFHDYLTALNQISFTKIITFLYLSIPIGGVIAANKLAPFFNHELSKTLAAFSAFATIICFITFNSIKKKAIFFTISAFSLCLYQINEPELFAAILLSAFLISYLLMLISNAAANEDDFFILGNFIKKTKTLFLFAILCCMLWIATLINMAHDKILITYVIINIIAMSYIVRKIFFTNIHLPEKIWDNLNNPRWLLFIPIIAITYYLYPLMINENVLIAFAIFSLLILLYPLRTLSKIRYLGYQDFFMNIFYHIIILPIKILGRILWLTIDFLFIEKTLITFIANANSLLMKIFNKIEGKNLIWVIIGFVILIIMLWGVK